MKITCPEEILNTNDDVLIYSNISDQLSQFAFDCGVAPEHAKKLVGVVEGRHAPAKLISPVCHVIDVNAFITSQGLRRERAVGYVPITPKDGRAAYQIIVDEDVNQHFFLLAYERLGPATAQGAERFWSYGLVVPETKTVQALCVALNLNFDGESYSLITSGAIYRTEKYNAITRRPEPTDRLAALHLPTNILAFAVSAGIVGGMPITDARQNRQSRQERAAASQQARYSRPNLNVAPPPMVAAGAAPATKGFNDPFGDQ